ncbi:hypothetical protein ES703_68469 [subsurface metagenome]
MTEKGKHNTRNEKGTFVKEGNNPPPEPEDFFRYEGKDPTMYYHWAETNPRRVQELKRKGYEIDPAASSSQAAKRVDAQREFLKKTIYDSGTTKENAQMAKELLNRMESTPVDTLTNIPGHVMMRTSMENRAKIMKGREEKSRKMEDKIEADIRDLNKAMQRSGKGGIKAFKDLFDSVKEGGTRQ